MERCWLQVREGQLLFSLISRWTLLGQAPREFEMSKPKFVVVEADSDLAIVPREICFSKDGRRIVGLALLSSSPERSKLLEWDASTGRRMDSDHAPVDMNCRRMLAAPDGDRIALLGERRIELFDSDSLRRIGGFKLSGKLFLGTLVWSPDGRFHAVNAPKLAVWDALREEKLRDFEDDMDPLGFTSMTPVGCLIWTSWAIRIWWAEATINRVICPWRAGGIFLCASL